MSRNGYLSQPELAYSLAIFCELKKINHSIALHHLEKNMRSFYKIALKDIKKRLDTLKDISLEVEVDNFQEFTHFKDNLEDNPSQDYVDFHTLKNDSYHLDNRVFEIKGTYSFKKGHRIYKEDNEKFTYIKSFQFEKIKNEFLNFINYKCPEKWESTSTVLSNYINTNEHPLFKIRGLKGPEGNITVWTFCIFFNHFSDSYHVSRDLAFHWFGKFVKEKYYWLSEFLSKFGFEMSGEYSKSSDLFFSIQKDGYALLCETEVDDANDNTPGKLKVNIDDMLTAYYSENVLEYLNVSGEQIFSDRLCKCQICSPHLRENSFPNLGNIG